MLHILNLFWNITTKKFSPPWLVGLLLFFVVYIEFVLWGVGFRRALANGLLVRPVVLNSIRNWPFVVPMRRLDCRYIQMA